MSLPNGLRPYYKTYDDYLSTYWWKHLKKKYIYDNPYAACFICGKTSTLLIHHYHYRNIHHEKPKRDIVLLCYNCHTQAHFYKFLGIVTKRVVMKEKNLRRRVLYLKSKNLHQKHKNILASWYFFRCMLAY